VPRDLQEIEGRDVAVLATADLGLRDVEQSGDPSLRHARRQPIDPKLSADLLGQPVTSAPGIVEWAGTTRHTVSIAVGAYRALI
jgi:hypothetical protein